MPDLHTGMPIDEGEAELVALALEVRDRAYAPYSRFAVGAAVRAVPTAPENPASGITFAGCNVENASFGLTICAERSAVFQAVAAGTRRIEAVAVVTDAPTPTMPCGACRQVLREFGPDMVVIGATVDGKIVRYRLSELLPRSFGPEDLPSV
jgi:cytidine deaminase